MIIVSIVLVVAVCWLGVLGLRKLGRNGIRQYQFGGENSVNIQSARDVTSHPRCACYMTSDLGISAPRLVRGRTCEMYFLNNGEWPAWCRGPEFIPRRTCCPTPPDTSHTGTCKNSLMRSGQERFFVNE